MKVDEKVEDKVEEKAETVEKEVEVSKDILDELKKTLTDHIDSKFSEKEEKAEEVEDKTKKLGNGKEETEEKAEVDPKVKFVQYLRALSTKDAGELAKYKDMMSTGVDADGGYLVPPAEFLAEVLRLEEQYGVARQQAQVRSTTRTSVLLNKKAGDVAIFETGEGAAKSGTKLTLDQVEVTLRKFAAIAPVTDELDEDSAVNIWNELTIDFARAYAKKEDELVFTDATSGIVNIAGTATQTVTGSSFSDVSYDDLNQAVYKVPTPSMKNGWFYFHRTILGVLQRIKDNEDRYIWIPGPNGVADGRIWGYPYALVEVMPALSESAADTGFIVFGDLKNTVLLDRTMLSMKMLEEGTITDADDESVNLAEQDAKALRVVKRFNAKTIFPEAYCVIKTGAATS